MGLQRAHDAANLRVGCSRDLHCFSTHRGRQSSPTGSVASAVSSAPSQGRAGLSGQRVLSACSQQYAQGERQLALSLQEDTRLRPGEASDPAARQSRRVLLQSLALGSLLASQAGAARAALLQLPATELNNEYYLVRAGESEAEAENYTLTNPVAKTSMSSGLSRHGKSQVVRETARSLVNMDACVSGCWIWPSITQRCYQTAEILASLLDISRSRIVPEYSFLDPRGVGSMEGLPLATVEGQLNEGDTASAEWRPPHGTDGTPNESVVDLLIRMRQVRQAGPLAVDSGASHTDPVFVAIFDIPEVLSITETQYRDSSIIIISPDSDNLSVIQAALVGADLRNHRNLYAFKPGEVRQLQLADSRAADFFDPRKFSCPNPPLCR